MTSNKAVVITENNETKYYIASEILLPAEDGTYSLTATVEDGVVNYSFSEGGSGGPSITYGTTDPSGGDVGDVYFKITE